MKHITYIILASALLTCSSCSDFSEKGKNYIATIYADTKDTDYKLNPQSYQIVKGLVNSKNKLKINTVEAGGYAVSLFEVTNSDEMKGLKKLSVSPIK